MFSVRPLTLSCTSGKGCGLRPRCSNTASRSRTITNSALGSPRGVSDRAAAAGGVAAPRTQSATFAGGAAQRQGPHREHEVAAGVDEGSSAHSRGSRGGARVLEGRRFSPEYRLRLRLLGVGERYPFVVQAQEASLSTGMIRTLGTGVEAVGVQNPRLSVVREIQLQVVGDP